MPQHITPRLPVSCENCRKRKIRCSGTRAPCDTCVRRGYPHSCQYKRSSDIPPVSPSNENELLDRIRNLEDLLKQSISQSARSPSEPVQGSSSIRSNRSSSVAESYDILPSKQSGSVVTSPTGYQRFLPTSSTLDTSLVQDLVDCIPSSNLESNFPFSEHLSSSRSTLLNILPPFRQCDELKDIFFQVFSPLFHVLHDPSFNITYAQFREDPSSASLGWVALLFVILAIAVTALDDNHLLLKDLGRESTAAANIKTLSARYRAAAMQCLSADQFLFQHNIHTVQTLVLLIYAMNHAGIPSWALLGTTLNISIAIGCHVDPSRLTTIMSCIEREQRRRVWAALMMLYTVQNTCFGNIAPQNITANVDLPADRDDDDFEGSSIIDHQSPAHLRQPTKMTYILYKFRLYKIAAQVCQNASFDGLASSAEVLALDQELEAEEKEHEVRFSNQALPVYHLAHHYILQSYTCHLYLILHRPFLNTTSRSNSYNSPGLQTHFKSVERCRTSAVTILEIHSHLYAVPDYKPYQWYVYGLGSFHAFLAVSTLTILMATSSINNQDRSQIQTLIEQCVKRLEAMAHRSSVCSKASKILRQVLPRSPPKTMVTATQQYQNVPVTDSSDPAATFQQFPISPQASPEQMSFPSYFGPNDWSINTQFQTAFFEMGPEQFMTPTTFSWDRWSDMTMA